MGCRVTMSLVSERQDGPIGDDWKYEIEAKVFNEGLKGKGQISVPKHTLSSGVTQEPHGAPEPVTMEAGECGGKVLLRVLVKATEVDTFISDKGQTSLDIPLNCPGPGETELTKETEISVGVRESPGISGETSIFRVVLRFTAQCA